MPENNSPLYLLHRMEQAEAMRAEFEYVWAPIRKHLIASRATAREIGEQWHRQWRVFRSAKVPGVKAND